MKIVFQRVVGPTRPTTKPPIASTKSTFPSSDGWNWMTPRSSQRFEPRTVSAATKTTTIRRQRRAVDELPGPAPDVERDNRRDDEPDRSDRRRESLPDDEVVLVAGNVEARDAGDDPEAVPDEAGSSGHEDPVEAAQKRQHRRLRATRSGADPRAPGDLDHRCRSGISRSPPGRSRPGPRRRRIARRPSAPRVPLRSSRARRSR